MRKQYKCKIHGLLGPDDRIVWSKEISGCNRWCKSCCNDMMDKYCGKLIEFFEDQPKEKGNEV